MSIYLTERIKYEVYYALVAKAREAATTWEKNGASFDMDKFHETLIQLTVQEAIKVMRTTEQEAAEECTYLGDDVPTIVHMNEIEKHFGLL
jgi:hypothetical protein